MRFRCRVANVSQSSSLRPSNHRPVKPQTSAQGKQAKPRSIRGQHRHRSCIRLPWYPVPCHATKPPPRCGRQPYARCSARTRHYSQLAQIQLLLSCSSNTVHTPDHRCDQTHKETRQHLRQRLSVTNTIGDDLSLALTTSRAKPVSRRPKKSGHKLESGVPAGSL